MEQIVGLPVFIMLIQSIIPAIPAVTALITSIGKFNEMNKKLDTCTRSISLLLMHDEHLDLEARIAAGDDFIAANGNGAGKTFHKELLRQYEEQLRERGTV
jgi:precorrin-3B methylase